MIDLNKRYETRDGCEVRALSQVNYHCDNPIQGYYHSGGEWRFGTWAKDGRWAVGLDEDAALDLVEVPAETPPTETLHLKTFSAAWYRSLAGQVKGNGKTVSEYNYFMRIAELMEGMEVRIAAADAMLQHRDR